MKQQYIKLLETLNKEYRGTFIQSDIEEYVIKIMNRATLITICNESKLLAFIAYYDNNDKSKKAFLTMLAVKTEYQNKGYGSDLLKKSIENLKKKGFIKYGLQVLIKNKQAIEFYKSHGFDHREKSNDHIYMEKRLK